MFLFYYNSVTAACPSLGLDGGEIHLPEEDGLDFVHEDPRLGHLRPGQDIDLAEFSSLVRKLS